MPIVCSITKQQIQTVPFDEFFDNLVHVNVDTHTKYFKAEIGNEHYRLLSYLSTKYNNSTLLDIGTCYGHSALALSYNTSNKVLSFDLHDFKTNPNIISRSNVEFRYENLLDTDVQNKWLQVIKDSPLIFFDIEPHEGILEYEFYLALKSINYQGIVIFDDIHHKEGMRRFWDKVPNEDKCDVTSIGHYSGSGIVSFKPLPF